MRRELGSARWTLFGVAYQTIFAYSVCLVFFQFASVATGAPFTIWTGFAILVFAVWMYMFFRKNPNEIKDNDMILAGQKI